MPIYEYECSACGHKHEALQKMADEPLTVCPACKQPALKKLISAVGFRLSGGGWYETDFKSKNQKNLAGDGASKPKASDAKAASKASSTTSNTQPSTKPAS